MSEKSKAAGGHGRSGVPIVAAALAAGLVIMLSGGRGREAAARARHRAEIRALEASLVRCRREVEAVTKELEAFTYSVSHDLRSPLRHISGYVELLTTALGDELTGEPQRYLGVITGATQQMSQLIDDLLAFARITRAEMRPVRVELRQTVTDSIASVESAAQGRKIEWHIGELPAVEGDPAMVKLIYWNLIHNAVKYSAPRDTARIEIGTAGEEDGRTILYVRDNGAGFDMKFAAKLFGLFQRMHHPDEFEGAGVGLAVVRRLVNRHGGRAWAEAAVDQGATFYFTLEKSTRAAPAS